MGFKTFRTSINWMRIFPTGMEKKPDEKGLAFYDWVFDCCKRHGMEPLVTLSHYEMPYALAEKFNGWESRELIGCFMNYCKTVFERYKDKVRYYLTFNEINSGTTPLGALLSTGTIKGFDDPVTQIPDNPQERYQALHHQLIASALAVKYAHDNYPNFKMGNMSIFAASYPAAANPDDVLANQHNMRKMNWYCSDVQVRGAYPPFSRNIWKNSGVKIKMEDGDEEILKGGKVDFYAFSYYMSSCISANSHKTGKGNIIAGEKTPTSCHRTGGGR